MGRELQLDELIDILRESNTPPLSIHVNGTITYVIYGARAINGVSGYPISRVTEPSASQTYFDAGFLTEAARLADSDRNIKTDSAGTIALLGTLSYG